jgi:SHS2 domain-containing protein
MHSPQLAGFTEITHTADWAIKVWAADLPDLFEQAAIGMVILMGVQFKPDVRQHCAIKLQAEDIEGLLVVFLDELLFFIEHDNLAFDQMNLLITGSQVEAELDGGFVLQVSKEIKAVTYHNLAVTSTCEGFTVTIVFDV